MKDSKLLRLLHQKVRGVIKWHRDNNVVIDPISKKYLPSYTYLRGLYNQAYFCMHAGLSDATLALLFMMLERITNDVYNTITNRHCDDSSKSWQDKLDFLEKFFTDKKKKREIIAIKSISEMKSSAKRNKHLHGDADGILQGYKVPAVKLDMNTGLMPIPVNEFLKRLLPVGLFLFPFQNLCILTYLHYVYV